MASNNFAKNEPVACSRFKAKPESCTLGYVVNDLFTIGRVYRFDPNTCAAGISARLRVAGESMRVGGICGRQAGLAIQGERGIASFPEN
jgi:hypothetical protein